MKITRKTRWKDVAPLLPQMDLDKVLDGIDEVNPLMNVIEMTCGDFIGLLENDSHIASKVIGRPKAAFIALGRLKALRRQMKEVADYITANDYTQDTLVQKAATGVRFPTPQERILLDVQQRYFLHSLDEAEKAPLTDYLLMVRDQTSRAKFENNMQVLQKQKYNMKSNRR